MEPSLCLINIIDQNGSTWVWTRHFYQGPILITAQHLENSFSAHIFFRFSKHISIGLFTNKYKWLSCLSLITKHYTNWFLYIMRIMYQKMGSPSMSMNPSESTGNLTPNMRPFWSFLAERYLSKQWGHLDSMNGVNGASKSTSALLNPSF